MPDRDGYPTKEEIRKVKTHPLDTAEDIEDFLDFLVEIWWEPEGGVRINRRSSKHVLKLALHTHGWSGNEEIIDALKQSYLDNLFWIRFWRCTLRGGHYYFRINLDTTKKG